MPPRTRMMLCFCELWLPGLSSKILNATLSCAFIFLCSMYMLYKNDKCFPWLWHRGQYCQKLLQCIVPQLNHYKTAKSPGSISIAIVSSAPVRVDGHKFQSISVTLCGCSSWDNTVPSNFQYAPKMSSSINIYKNI